MCPDFVRSLWVEQLEISKMLETVIVYLDLKCLVASECFNHSEWS